MSCANVGGFDWARALAQKSAISVGTARIKNLEDEIQAAANSPWRLHNQQRVAAPIRNR